MSINLSMITMILIWIFKALGIIMLSALGLILFTLLLILFIPIRYNVKASLEETLMGHDVNGRCSWLFRTIHIPFRIIEGEVDLKVKVLGINIYPRKKKQGPKSLNTNSMELIDDLTMDNVNNSTPSEESSVRESYEVDIENIKDNNFVGGIRAHKAKVLGEYIDCTQLHDKPRSSIKYHKYNLSKDNNKEDADIGYDIREQKTVEKYPIFNHLYSYLVKVKNLWIQFQRIIRMPRNYFKKWNKTFKKLKWHFKELCDMIRRVIKGKETIIKFWGNERHKITFNQLKKELLFIWKHSKPKKLQISANFGFEDPAITGQVMAILGAAMPIIGEYELDITPYFNEEIIELNGILKGRVYLYHILFASLRMLREKENRLTYRAIKRLKF